jgi:hypothetical protein
MLFYGQDPLVSAQLHTEVLGRHAPGFKFIFFTEQRQPDRFHYLTVLFLVNQFADSEDSWFEVDVRFSIKKLVQILH